MEPNFPKAGVLGYPVSHSLSPLIFQFLSSQLHSLLDYQKIEVHPEEFETVISSFKLGEKGKIGQFSENLLGLNVTLPYKEKVLAWLNDFSPEAAALQAVNVVKSSQGQWTGFNTDVFGVSQTLIQHEVSADLPVVIFGAGGASLSVGYALGQLNFREVWILNRTQEKALRMGERLQKLFPNTKFQTESQEAAWRFSDRPFLWVNATPLGMKGFLYRELLPSSVHPSSVAFDLIYRPLNTPFLQSAEVRGVSRRLGGLDMLIWQALKTWEIWQGTLPEGLLEHLYNGLKQHLLDYLDGLKEGI